VAQFFLTHSVESFLSYLITIIIIHVLELQAIFIAYVNELAKSVQLSSYVSLL